MARQWASKIAEEKTMSVSVGSRLRRSGWVVRLAAVGAVVFAAVGAAVTVSAQEHGAAHGMRGDGPPPMMFGGPSEHMVRMMDHLLDGLGVSDAQRRQIRQIAMAAAADVKAQHDASRGLRDQAAQIFTSATVDASAAERLRQQMLTQQDQSSKRILQAMLDISGVLTPEQRAKLGERMKDRQAIMQDRMQRMQHDGPASRSRP